MRVNELSERLVGAIAFPITPFERSAGLPIDEDAFREHIEFVAASGVAALVVAGGTGEFFSLEPREIIRLARLATDVVGNRVPIVVGVGRNVAEGRQLARELRNVEVDGLLLMPPYYSAPDRESLVGYYASIAGAVPDTSCVFYARDHVRLDVDLLHALAETQNIVAVKDGQGSVREFLHARAALGDRFRWLGGAGDDLVGAYASAGAAGYTSSLACFDPQLSLRLWEFAAGGAPSELDALLMKHVIPWYTLRALRRGYEVAVVKAGVEAFGGTAGPVRPPLANLSGEHMRRVSVLAEQIGKLEV
jgi:5-dehydro-4-deoxyglucarate dehydratase